MKDWFHLILGIVGLILATLLTIGFHNLGYAENWNLVYIGIIAFVCGCILFVLNPLVKPCKDR